MTWGELLTNLRLLSKEELAAKCHFAYPKDNGDMVAATTALWSDFDSSWEISLDLSRQSSALLDALEIIFTEVQELVGGKSGQVLMVRIVAELRINDCLTKRQLSEILEWNCFTK